MGTLSPFVLLKYLCGIDNPSGKELYKCGCIFQITFMGMYLKIISISIYSQLKKKYRNGGCKCFITTWIYNFDLSLLSKTDLDNLPQGWLFLQLT